MMLGQTLVGKRNRKKGATTERAATGQASPLVVPDRAKRPARLEQILGPGAPREFALEVEETVIGRSDEADISIDAGLISREHVAFRKAGLQIRFIDLDSANGVYLNGCKAHSTILHEGDTLQVGDVVLVFHDPD